MTAGAITSMIFTGVFERFPELQICWIETGVGWIPHFLEAIDDRYWRNRVWGDLPINEAAVVRTGTRNNAASFIIDRSGVALRHPAGVENMHVVERLPAPRQRLAVLAQGHRRDAWATSRPTSAS